VEALDSGPQGHHTGVLGVGVGGCGADGNWNIKRFRLDRIRVTQVCACEWGGGGQFIQALSGQVVHSLGGGRGQGGGETGGGGGVLTVSNSLGGWGVGGAQHGFEKRAALE
jgi:hypothetical protein